MKGRKEGRAERKGTREEGRNEWMERNSVKIFQGELPSDRKE